MNALIADDDPLVGLTLRHFLEKADKSASCTHVTDGAAALRALAGGGFDVLFLDLELPELDGRNVLQALPPELPVIVVSAHTDFAARSYDFGVVDYLVKPLEFSRFHRAWQKLLARRRSPREITATVAPPPTVRSISRGERDPIAGRTMVVRDGSRLVQISFDRLLFLEAESNYTRLVCTDRSLLTLVSLKQLAESLPDEFMRVHRSYIVNTQHIHQIEGTTIKIGEHKIPVGETYRDEVLKRFSPVN